MDTQSIHDACDLSIRRACGFVALAIFTAMVGLSYHPFVAIRVGAMLTTIAAIALVIKGLLAPRRPYRNTEAWLILGKKHGLPEDRAQKTFGGILRESYLWHATVAGALALPMWIVDIYLAFFGQGPLPN